MRVRLAEQLADVAEDAVADQEGAADLPRPLADLGAAGQRQQDQEQPQPPQHTPVELQGAPRHRSAARPPHRPRPGPGRPAAPLYVPAVADAPEAQTARRSGAPNDP